MEAELQTAFDEQKKTFEAFKATNDKLGTEVKELGTERAETKEAMAKIEADLQKWTEKVDKMLAAGNRPLIEGKDDPDAKTAEQKERRAAFQKYLRRDEKGLSPDELKVLLVSDDTTGGFLATDDFVQEIDKDVIEFSPIRPLARIRPTSKRSVMLPRRTGTFSAVWGAEGVSIDETEGLAYGREQVHVHPLTALVDVSAEDLEDPEFDIEAELRMEFAEQFGVAEGTAFVLGDGAGKPEGILEVASSGVTEQDTATSNVLDGNDLIDLMYNLKSAYWGNSTWVMNRVTIGRVRKLRDDDGQYLWQPGLNGPQQQSLLGRPLAESPDMNATLDDDVQIVIFGDIRRLYTVVDRIALSILRDPFSQSSARIVRFVASKRVGGQVIRSEAARILTVKA